MRPFPALLLSALLFSGCSAFKDFDINKAADAGQVVNIPVAVTTDAVPEQAEPAVASADPATTTVTEAAEEPLPASKPEVAVQKATSKPKPQVAPAANVTVLDKVAAGFYVQITAKPDRSEADFRTDTLKSFGYAALTQSAIVNGTTFFRVLVGPFKSRAEAQAKAEEVRSAVASDEVPFVQRF